VPGSIKGKAYRFARRTLLDRLDPAETFLSNVPQHTAAYQARALAAALGRRDSLCIFLCACLLGIVFKGCAHSVLLIMTSCPHTGPQVVAPSDMDPSTVRRQFRALLNTRPGHHRIKMIASSSLLPVTLTVFTLLPGPV
jgi:hypothetical protein